MGSLLLDHLKNSQCIDGGSDVLLPVRNTFIHFGSVCPERHPLQRSVTDPSPHFLPQGAVRPMLRLESSSTPPGEASSEEESSVEGDVEPEAGRCAYWHVDGRRLHGKDTHMTKAVQLALPGHAAIVEFVVSMYPKAVSTSRGGSNFRAASGVGTLHVKCNQVSEASLALCLIVGGDIAPQSLVHDFGASPVATFPGEWDFQDESTRSATSPTFVIALAAAPLPMEQPAVQGSNIQSVLEASPQVCNTPAVWMMPDSAWTPADTWAYTPWIPAGFTLVPPWCSQAVPVALPPVPRAEETSLSPYASPNASPRASQIGTPIMTSPIGSPIGSPSESNDGSTNLNAEFDTCYYGCGATYAFTIRKAEGKDLGLDIVWSDCGRVLLVRGIATDGAVDAWNRQCDEGPSVGRMVLPGDIIRSVNGKQGCELMLDECKGSLLLKMVLERGVAGP